MREPIKRIAARYDSGFTLPELLVVMGIIVLFIALAIPAMSVLMGSRSIDGAENNLSAALVRTREEAIGLQEIRGLLFTIDPATDRVMASMIHQVDAPPAPSPSLATLYASTTWLDTVTDRDFMLLPPGIRLQTAFDGQFVNAPQERFLGYNANPFGKSGNSRRLGGVILFDGNGRLIARSYGLKMTRIDPATGSKASSGVADMFLPSANDPATNMQIVGTNEGYIPTNDIPSASNAISPRSQLALVLLDKKTFEDAGFVDADAQPNESTKEDWIDTNATPFLINRFTGVLLRGE